MKEETRHRQGLVHFGKLLHEHGYVAATDGNLSVRLDGQSVLITPTCVSKGMMRPQDPIPVDMHGHKLAGQGSVSSEIGMHLLIYKVRPDVNAIVHAHPPVATGYAAAGIPLNPALVCEAIIGLGAVPLAPYATPGTPALADVLRPLIPEHEAILMANHGVVTYGEDLLRAYLKMELVEHFATISLVTKLLGQEHLLNAKEIERLRTTRPKYPHEDLLSPERVHVDSYGNVHLCQGLSMGNIWEKPLPDLLRDYDAQTHPIAGPLIRGGPTRLVTEHGLALSDGYVDECHLCYTARKLLLPRFPEYLAPKEAYGL